MNGIVTVNVDASEFLFICSLKTERGHLKTASFLLPEKGNNIRSLTILSKHPVVLIKFRAIGPILRGV